ncbi:MAG TPA: c-type cytochrome [Acidimicrobiales bacterium]|nr:c-type cytochrome [Acidimicrobiales bacterium]
MTEETTKVTEETTEPVKTKRRRLFVLPALVVTGVAVVGLLSPGASSAAPSASLVALNASAPPSSITYTKLPQSYIGPGEQLFEANCASCHGVDGTGGIVGVNLVGLGPATADFWVGTGRMPLGNIAQQPVQKTPRFPPKQILQIAAFVGSLGPAAPGFPSGIPVVNLNGANLTDGNSLFVLNCAACHTITGSGDALADGYSAPTLHKATAVQAVEALRTGPANMPHFGPGQLNNQQIADIVAYVLGPIQHPNNAGGLGLGGIGPVAEGFIALFIGVGGLMLVAFWVGDRS